MFAFYLPASVIVRTEPQSEIGRKGKKYVIGFIIGLGTLATAVLKHLQHH